MSKYKIIVIGLSFRDITIASVLDDVLSVRARKNKWSPLGDDLEERAKYTR